MSAGSWILVAILLTVLALALRSIIKARKTGCGGACAGCAAQSSCQTAAREAASQKLDASN